MSHTSTTVYDSTVYNYAKQKSETTNSVPKVTANDAPFSFTYLSSVFTVLRLIPWMCLFVSYKKQTNTRGRYLVLLILQGCVLSARDWIQSTARMDALISGISILSYEATNDF